MNASIDLLAATLLHFLWQGCAIALAYALCLRVCTDPSRRYATGLAALVVMLAAPVATVAWLTGTPSVVEPGFVAAAHGIEAASGSEAPSDLASSTASSPFTAASQEPSAIAAQGFIVGFWLLGVVACASFNFAGWIRLRSLRRAASPLPSWSGRMAELCCRLALRRPVRLLVSQRIDVPMVVGWLKPVVLVPSSAVTGMSPTLLEALLLHELAHIKRHDYLVNLLQATVESLLFYHPAVWWVSRTVRAEREHLCDDLAVASCDRRSDYMQALADLERRRLTPTLAVAADGGSLMTRIKRLTAATLPEPSAAATRAPLWSLSAAALGLILVGALLPVTAPLIAGANHSAPLVTGTQTVTARAGDTLEGEWRSEDKDTHIQLELRIGSRHRHGFWVDRDDLEQTATGYVLRRDAGDIELLGALDAGWSRFVFRPDPTYVDEMSRIGFQIEPTLRKQFEMASIDVSLEFARGVAAAGYDDISTSRLVEFRIHGVDRQFIDGITSAGLEDLSPSRLVEFRIHGVSPDFVRGMTDSGFSDLSASRLVEFRIHGVSPDYVAAMADSGLAGLSASRLVEFRIHGVSPDFVRALSRSGLEGLDASKLVEFRIHGVSPEFVEEMNALVDDLTPSRLVEMRIHGVTPQYAARALDQHGGPLSASELVSMRIHGRKF